MIYLASAISSPDPQIQKENIARMIRKADELRNLGFDVYCPPENEPKNITWGEAMKLDLTWMWENRKKIDFVYVMYGSQDSKGVQIEIICAELWGIKVVYE